MGKNLIQQKRGKGSPTYRSPSFRYAGRVVYPKVQESGAQGEIVDILHSQGHSAPLLVIKYDGEYNLNIAPEGVRVGDKVIFKSENIEAGNIMELKNIPEGTAVYNIESKPGDGGKFVRTSGGTARVVSKMNDKVVLRLPSKRNKEFSSNCLATIGIIAGSGRPEKPFLKAGIKFFHMKARNKLWPMVDGVSMNAVNHPFGGKGSHTKGRPTQSARNSPPGRKVGKIAPRRTGRKK